jgi:hypothetical protein
MQTRFEKEFALMMGCSVLYLLFIVGLIGLAVFVAYHFLMKIW